MSDHFHITPSTSIGSVLAAIPSARRALFAKYHLGGCQACGFPDEETIASLCERNGNISPAEMISHLLAAAVSEKENLISAHELKNLLDSPTPPLLLDCRTREEHDAVKITNSIFLTQELQQKIFSENPEQTIILYDHSGKHALDTCSWFQGHGLKNTKVLAGGIDAWSKEIDPTIPRYTIEIET